MNFFSLALFQVAVVAAWLVSSTRAHDGDFCVDLDATALEELDDEGTDAWIKDTNHGFMLIYPSDTGEDCTLCQKATDLMSDISDSVKAANVDTMTFASLDAKEYGETAKTCSPEEFWISNPDTILIVYYYAGKVASSHVVGDDSVAPGRLWKWVNYVMMPVMFHEPEENLATAVEKDLPYFLVVGDGVDKTDEETGETTTEVSQLIITFVDTFRTFEVNQGLGYNTTTAPFGIAEEHGQGIFYMHGNKVMNEFNGRLTKTDLKVWLRIASYPSPINFDTDFLMSLDKSSPDTKVTCFLTAKPAQWKALEKFDGFKQKIESMKPHMWMFFDNAKPPKSKQKAKDYKPMYEDLGTREHRVDILCSPMYAKEELTDFLFPREHMETEGEEYTVEKVANGIMENIDEFVRVSSLPLDDPESPKRFFKSEQIEEPQDPKTGVYHLTKNNVQDIMCDGEKDSLMFIYAHDCQHCKKFMGTFNKIASLILGDDPVANNFNPSVNIGKFNYKYNSGVGMGIMGVPDVRVYQNNATDLAGGEYNEDLIIYQGDRTAGKIVRWIANNVLGEFNMPDLSSVIRKKNKKKKNKEEVVEEKEE